ncbi:MAG TPA: tetratricopeptide repeat protein [Planctomycetota bacterium]|nr:tetratricopeptide repeat protein [Planctomycetota bacterium]
MQAPMTPDPQAIPLARRALSLAVLALAASLALWPILRGDFVYDDLWLVARNPNLATFQAMWASLGGSYWDFIDAQSSQYVGYWRPLTTITLFVGHTLGHGSPTAFHAISLVLHVVASALVTALAWKLTRRYAVALCVGLLFAVHPVQVEPVAWISSVNDPLAGVFTFATLLAYLGWRERESRGLPIASAVFFLCALLAKESALAVLPLVFALDLGRPKPAGAADEDAPLARGLRPFLRPYATLLAAFVVYYTARVIVFGDAWAGFERTIGQLGLTAGRELTLRVELFGGALALMAWPRTLNLFRDTRPEIPWNDGPLWIAILCIALWTVALAWSWKKRARPLVAGLLVIPAAMLPAIVRIEALGRFSLSERYLYVSVFGFCLFAVSALSRISARLSLANLGYAVIALLALSCGWRSRVRTHDWQDERTLFARSYEDNENSPYVAWGFGRVMLQDFRVSQDVQFLGMAKAAFEHSLDLGLKDEQGKRDLTVLVTQEDRLQANLGLGWCYLFGARSGYDEATLDEALGVFEKTLGFFPRSFEALTCTAIVMMEQGDLPAARARLASALEINSKHLEAWYYLGKLELRSHDLAAARTAFEHALALKFDDVDTLPLYAGVLAEQGEVAAARRALELAQQIAPQDPAVLMGLGNLAAKNRDGGEALKWFDRLLQFSPTYAPAYLQKGKVLASMNQMDRALAALQKACELNPNDFESHYTLGALLANQGLGKEALPFLQRALDVGPGNPLAPQITEQIEKIKAQ